MAKVMLFGRLGDVAGWSEREVVDAPTTLSALRALLAAESATLTDASVRPGVQVAVDRTLTRGDVDIRPGAEIAFLPPMSGG